jgi:uncharacterized protein (PEP-CTERM system associated)
MAKPHRSAKRFAALPLATPVAMLAVLMASPARADWKVTPNVELRETYTDNVRLEADQLARSQFVTDFAPSLTIANDGPRLKLSAAAVSHLYAYSDDRIDGTNRSQFQLQANAKAKLVEGLLFLDGAASIGQQAISAFGPQVDSGNGYSSANRTKVSTYRISPYLAHRFGAAATAELRYVRDSVKSGNVGLGDSTGDTVSLSIASGPAYRTVGWGLQYSRQDLDDTLARKSRAENASASLRFLVAPRLTLNANGGYDKYDYQGLGGATAGKSYSLGFTWSPSLRTSIQASAGKRYFGSSYSLIASHRSRHSVWSVNYTDAVTTSRQQFLLPAAINTAAMLDRLFSTNIPDPAARLQAVDAYIRATGLPPTLADSINYFSNRFILQKQFQASAAFNTAKTTTVVSLNATKRNALSSQQSDSALLGSNLATLNDNTKQAGAGVVMNYRISSRTGVNLALTSGRTESLSTGIKDNHKSLSLAMTRQFQRKLKGAVELRRSQGNAAIQGGRTYRENAVSASLSLQL